MTPKYIAIVAAIVFLGVMGWTNHFGFSFWILANPTPPGYPNGSQQQQGAGTERRASEGRSRRPAQPESDMDAERAALIAATPHEARCTGPWFGYQGRARYYIDPQDDRLRCFDRPGHSPYSGRPLVAITPEFVEQVRAAEGTPAPACTTDCYNPETVIEVPAR